MNFTDIANRFAKSSSGTDAFKLFYKSAFDLMKTDPDNAGLYFVVGIAAQSFVRRYEDQGISTEFAEQAKSKLDGFNQKLILALEAEPIERLRLLGEVAIDYEWHVPSF
ncbi:hypothetical protein [Variovorax sp. PvP013]|uniref:hypothetical protein n=1 Tax=Variovorax sp. PvP013 TaxID=3156435 RepID=UPI003D2332E2